MRFNSSFVLLVVAGVFSLIIARPAHTAPIDLSIISGTNWLSSDTFQDRWQTVGFDDTRWESARSPYPNPTDETTLIPDTKAEFMWYDPYRTSDGTTGSNEAFFRFSFNLTLDDSLPLVAQAFVNADDDYEFYVNGDLVAFNKDGGYADVVDFVDFRSSLINGTNVFAIHAVDGGWYNPRDRLYERVLFDGVITTVSEPATLLLMLSGLLGAAFAGRRCK